MGNVVLHHNTYCHMTKDRLNWKTFLMCFNVLNITVAVWQALLFLIKVNTTMFHCLEKLFTSDIFSNESLP